MQELIMYPQLKWGRPESGALSLREAKVNCGAAGGAALANWALQRSGDRLISHHDFRIKAGDPRNPDGSPKGLGTAQVQDALAQYGVTSVRHYGDSTDLISKALSEGKAVGMGIWYPYINNNYPELSGQLTFKGNHFVVLKRWYAHAPKTRAYDPLFDGRCRTWGCAPDGDQRAPIRAYKGAASAMRVIDPNTGKVVPIGVGKGVFIIVDAPVEVTP